MVSPERPNITYGVLKMSNQVHVIEYFDWLLQMIKSKGNQSDRCIIYCQTVNQCSTLYFIILSLSCRVKHVFKWRKVQPQRTNC